MNHVYVRADTDNQIQQSALHGNWGRVTCLFRVEPRLKIKPVNERLETPLMIAVGTNRSHEFVKQLLGYKFCNYDSLSLDENEWCGVNIHGNNALHYAAIVGNIIDAKIMEEHFTNCFITMSTAKNEDGDTPLLLAARLGRKDMIDQVFQLFGEEDNLIVSLIEAGLLDLALEILYFKPPEEITSNGNALEALATKPEFFPSGNRLGFWGGLIYQCMPSTEIEIPKVHEQDDEHRIHISEEHEQGAVLIEKWRNRLEKSRSAYKYVKIWAPAIKNIQDIKIKNELGIAIVKYLCKIVMAKKNWEVAREMFGSAIAKAVKYGIYEIVEECIVAYPEIFWHECEKCEECAGYKGHNWFHLAIKERQVQVYNLVYQMSGYKEFTAIKLHEDETTLHFAARLAPPYRLSTQTGALMKLQWEVQWYKEIESLQPELKVAVNKAGKTPWMVFIEKHENLLKEGQQWMKDTATSCTVIAVLIMTITFAAAITGLGGYKDDGEPVFLNERAFMLFMISDAIALFSSSTSLLMFLGILTSRYAEMDFLYTLPNRLTIGLVSLFLSIAATMIAFGASLVLLLHDKVIWIPAPVVMITSIPVVLYALLQFPLLVGLVCSTYGPSIFRKQSSRIIY